MLSYRRCAAIVALWFLYCGCFAQTQDDLKPFVVDHRKALLAHSPVDVSFLLDAPAGKHGFIGVRDGHLATSDGQRIRLWGMNVSDWSPGSTMIPSKEDAPLWASTLARFGVNCVRLQFLDLEAPRGLLNKNREDSQGFDSGQFDREDFFLSELEKRGIYIDINLLVGRRFKAGDRLPDYDKVRQGAKQVSLFDARMIELQKDYARQLLDHLNPYTKLEYREDPAVAFVEINNENALSIGSRERSPFYDSELTKLYNQWLLRNLPGPEIDSLRALTQVSKNEQIPLMHGQDEIANAPKERFYAESRFLNDTERNYFEDMRNFLKDTLGVKSIIIATADHSHAHSGYPILLATSSFESVDGHTYWEHPGEHSPKKPMVDDPLNSTVAELSRSAVAGKPYTVSEVNNPFPNPYGSEGIPILAAYGDLQDWDAIMFWTFEPKRSADWKPYVGDAFDMSLDPVKMAELAGGALTFLRSDISPARVTIQRTYTPDQVFDSARLPGSARPYFTPGFPSYLALEHEVRIASLNGPPTQPFVSVPPPESIVSDTAQLKWYTSAQKGGLVTVDAPRTQALIGFVRANGKSATHLAAKVQNTFCTIVLTSLDSKPIEESSRMLLTTGSRIENTAMQWNPDHSGLSDWGHSPSLIEPVEGTIMLRGLSGAGAVLVRALDGSGQPFGAPNRTVRHGRDWQISIGSPITTWYEITVRGKGRNDTQGSLK